MDLYSLFHCASAFLCIGYVFAILQRKFPSIRHDHFYEDMMSSVLIGLTGPYGVVATTIVLVLRGDTNYYGWLWPWSEQAKREAGLL